MSLPGAASAAIQAGADGPRMSGAGTEPIVLLTFPYSGAEVLSDMICALPGVVCTSRTGVIPLCHAAASTWKNIDRSRQPLSPLAVASIRSLTSPMLAVLAADSGARRWCETVISGAPVAETFLRVYPGARFICFYRRCDSVIADVVSKNPWGLGDTDFWLHPSAAQGNSVATIAGHWLDRVQGLLEFEAAHAQSAIRARYEDLGHPSAVDALCEFASLPSVNRVSEPIAPCSQPPAAAPAPAPVPTSRIPPAMRQRVNELHDRLGYPPLLPSGCPGTARLVVEEDRFLACPCWRGAMTQQRSSLVPALVPG